MIKDYRASIEKNFGYFPYTLEQVFLPGKVGDPLTISIEYFRNGLEGALKKVKSDKIGRYTDLAKFVFSYINFLYELQERQNFKSKLQFLLKKGEILDQIDLLYSSTYQIFSEYLNVPKINAEEFRKKIDEFFASKEKLKKHTQTTRDFSKIFGSGFLKHGKIDEYLRYVRTLEFMIHGIDDYVDEAFQSQEDRFLNVAGIVSGLFETTYSIIEEQRHNLKDNFMSALLNQRTKMEKIIDAFAQSLIDLTYVPFVEEETKNLLKITDINQEIQLAIKNIDTRASVVNVYLNFADIYLSQEKSENFVKLKKLIRLRRSIELLNKDIDDIEIDIKNEDWRPASIWSIKYSKGEEFSKRIGALANHYQTKTLEIYSSMTNYKVPASICIEMIKNDLKSIGDKI